MSRPIAFTSLLAFALLAPALSAAPKLDLERTTPVPNGTPIPIQDFFRLPAIGQPQLNPSGTHVAALMAVVGQDKSVLTAYELVSQKTETMGGVRDQDIYGFQWLNDKRLMFQLGTKKMYGMGLLAADLGRFNRSYPLQMFAGARIISVPQQNRLRPLVQVTAGALEIDSGDTEIEAATINTDVQNNDMVDLSRIGLAPGDVVKTRRNNQSTIVSTKRGPKAQQPGGFMADKQGNLEYAMTYENGVMVLHYLADGDWKRSPIDFENRVLVGPGRRAREVAVRDIPKPDQPARLLFMDAATGEAGDVLVQDKGYDFSGWLYRDPATREITGAVYNRNGPHVVWFRDDYREVQRLLNSQFPGQVVRILDNSEDGKVFVVATWSDRHPTVYHWINLANRSAGLIKNSAPWIDPERMSAMNTIKVKTRDGKTIDAYVTLPKGATKENPPPLVVLSHGGPWARDYWGYNGEVQFLASRGYAVLQTNYRGSTGSDWQFPFEDRFDFVKMHDDVTDATKALIKSGLVDGKRVGIMGASFGAYLALSGVTREPDLYRCAVTNAGVYDWEEIVRDRRYDKFDDPQYAYLVRYLGDPRKEKEKFETISPGRHVDKVRVPVFVAHGKDDPIAPITEARRLISALQRHQVPHEVHLVSDEGHGMGHVDEQVELYGLIEIFLDKNLKNAK